MKVETLVPPTWIDLADAKVGDVVIVADKLNAIFPLTLLKTYYGWVSLRNPNQTWEGFDKDYVFGQKLPKGTTIKLTVE